MVSMMNVRKDLLKFATLDRASSISSASWVRGLMIIGLTCFVIITKLVIIKHLSNFFKHSFLDFLTLFQSFILAVPLVSQDPIGGLLVL